MFTVNERGSAFYVHVFIPSRELCCLQIGNVIFVCVKEIVNLSYQFSSREKKLRKSFCFIKLLVCIDMEVREELNI